MSNIYSSIIKLGAANLGIVGGIIYSGYIVVTAEGRLEKKMERLESKIESMMESYTKSLKQSIDYKFQSLEVGQESLKRSMETVMESNQKALQLFIQNELLQQESREGRRMYKTSMNTIMAQGMLRRQDKE